jgi:hypothetical protein
MPEWTVELPPTARLPFDVYVNGVRQQEGADYRLRGRTLVFTRALAKDEVSKKRWFLGAWGVGTYRKDDSVDVAWTGDDGAPRVAHRLDISAPTDA